MSNGLPGRSSGLWFFGKLTSSMLAAAAPLSAGGSLGLSTPSGKAFARSHPLLRKRQQSSQTLILCKRVDAAPSSPQQNVHARLIRSASMAYTHGS
jgi:hypothetical protein